MRGRRSLTIGALAATAIMMACDLAADVVARVDAPDASVDGPPVDASLADYEDAAAQPCYGYPTTFDLVTSTGGIYSFDFTTGMTTAVSRPDCNITSGAAIAVNRERDLVIADQEGSLFIAKADGGACTKSLLVSVPSAMAFRRKDGEEQLYAVIGTRLAVIDTTSSEVSTVASLSPAPSGTIYGLIGTVDGRLLLLSKEEDTRGVVISEVDPGTGAFTMIDSAGESGDAPPPAFVGGAPTPTGFELVFGTDVWTHTSGTTSLTFHAALMTNDSGIAGVGKWPCGP